MHFKIGDYVSRNSYNNDTLFKITEIEENNIYLKGVNIRLYADSPPSDLKLEQNDISAQKDDDYFLDRANDLLKLNRSSFFYLPGKILHIDGDDEYLNRCLKFYKKLKVQAYGIKLKEQQIPLQIRELLTKLKPDIVIITGHDYFLKNKKDIQDVNNYRNSKFFIEAVKVARDYEKAHDKLVIVAGACQSDYEELIKAGSNFASSPKRVNIHALDPAIVAVSVALSERDKPIDIVNIISKTKYKEEGMGGIVTNGMMYRGYPR